MTSPEVEKEAPGQARHGGLSLNTIQVLPAESSGGASRAPVAGAYKVDISHGERIGRVSSEWLSRPDDERYLSLNTV